MDDKIRWEYQVAANKWACYNDEIATFLNGIAHDSAEKCTFDIDEWTVEFDFKKMQQKNLDSKFEKNFRCTIKAENGEFYAWDFADGVRYQSFPINLMSDLEKRYALSLNNSANSDSFDNEDQTMEIELNGEKLILDFSSNIMTGSKNGNTIRFRRQQSNAEKDPGPDCGPVPSQSSAPISFVPSDQSFSQLSEGKQENIQPRFRKLSSHKYPLGGFYVYEPFEFEKTKYERTCFGPLHELAEILRKERKQSINADEINSDIKNADELKAKKFSMRNACKGFVMRVLGKNETNEEELWKLRNAFKIYRQILARSPDTEAAGRFDVVLSLYKELLPTIEYHDNIQLETIIEKGEKMCSVLKTIDWRPALLRTYCTTIHESCAIEDNKMTLSKVCNCLLQHKPGLRLTSFREKTEVQEHNEIIALSDAYVYMFEHGEREISLEFVCEVHRHLYPEALEPPCEEGQKKIGGSVKDKYKEKAKMLLDWINKSMKENKYDPLTLATIAHFGLATFHVFGDGNGRISRCIADFIFMKAGLPPAVIPFKKIEDYFSALSNSAFGDLRQALRFFGDCLLETIDQTCSLSDHPSFNEILAHLQESTISDGSANFMESDVRTQNHSNHSHNASENDCSLFTLFLEAIRNFNSDLLNLPSV
ncbi:fic/DOC family domain-containing protein [Ditylenchus destructor]|uniref:Fic/DOC family domain-containing protein n=1 Tax=Ditylenchus destructor TaxID=166010 RepID=A0AAD4QZV6_9BILA|nr:fic/DOC family domain-containing protein [Ditylenchus destructor]